jgi:hypothetical protein
VVGQLCHLIGRMADVEHRNIQLAMQSLQVGQDFLPAFEVQCRQRFNSLVKNVLWS